MTSSTVDDRSKQGQSFPGMKMSSVLLRLSFRRCAAVQAEMSAKHSAMRVSMWVLEEDGGKRQEQLAVVCITVVRESR